MSPKHLKASLEVSSPRGIRIQDVGEERLEGKMCQSDCELSIRNLCMENTYI